MVGKLTGRGPVGHLLPPEELTAVLGTALARGGDWAEVYVEDTVRNGCRMEDGRLDRAVSGRERGASVRLVKGGRTFFSYTERLDRDSLQEAAIAVRSGLGEVSAGKQPAALQERRPAFGFPVQRPYEDSPAGEAAGALAAADRAARAEGSEIVQVTATYNDKRQRFTVAASDGRLASDERDYIRLVVQAVARRGDRIETGFEGPGEQMGMEYLERHDPAATGREAARRALVMLEAAEAPAGVMPVVLAGGHGGVLFHEACGHGFETDTIAKGSSVFAGKRGEKVASGLVTLLDDATLPGGWGSYAFDDEGSPGEKTYMIRDGVLESYISDVLKGEAVGMQSTGNGRRESFRQLPIPRMSNTYLLAGGMTAGEIIAATKNGLFAAALSGGQVEPATGQFVFGVAEAYIIEDGRLGRPVKGATLIGSGPEILMAVDMVGDDLSFKPGMCGKDGQSVPVGTGQPTVRISAMTVGGTALRA